MSQLSNTITSNTSPPVSNYCPISVDLVRTVLKDEIQSLFKSYRFQALNNEFKGPIYLGYDGRNKGNSFHSYVIIAEHSSWFKTLKYQIGRIYLYVNDDETVNRIHIGAHGTPTKFESLVRRLRFLFSSVKMDIVYTADRPFVIE